MRIDMTASEWHHLVKPVLPHITKEAEFPELSQVRIEVGGKAIYAAASDRYTMGVERLALDRADQGQSQPPIHVRLDDIHASLKLFAYTKDDDPALSVTVDTVAIPVEIMGDARSHSALAVTLQSAAGARMVMHDRRIEYRDPLAGWQRAIATAMSRTQGGTPAGLDLNPGHLGRWAAAVRGGERLTLWTGPQRKNPVLVTVESHFAGLWMPMAWGNSDVDMPAPPDPAGLPWLAELDGVNPETGELMTGDDSISGD